MKKRRKLNGKWWTLKREKIHHSKNAYGLCDEQKRVVTLGTGITPEEEIATVVHEAAHIALPDATEPCIERVELTIMKCLKAYGLIPKEEE